MIYANEKLLLSLNSHLEMIPGHADRISMREIMDLLYVRWKADECVKLINNKTASIRIHEMEIDSENDIVSMLIHYSDKSVSDPVFQDLNSGTLRRESKLEGEGIAVSAHLAISLKPIEPEANTYDTVLEEVPGVSRSKLTPFFHTEFGAVSDFSFNFEGELQKSRPTIVMTAKASKGLKDDLEKGVFSGITLERYDVQDFMDEKSIMKTTKASIALKVKRNKMTAHALKNPFNIVKNIFNQAKKEGYDNVVVHYKNENKKSKTVNIDTKLQQAKEVVFTKSVAIKLEKNVDQCVPEFNNEILVGMKDLIIALRSSREE